MGAYDDLLEPQKKVGAYDDLIQKSAGAYDDLFDEGQPTGKFLDAGAPLDSPIAGLTQRRESPLTKPLDVAGMKPQPSEIRASPDTVYRSENPAINAALGVPRALVHGAEQVIQAGAGFAGNHEARKASERRVQGLTLAAPKGMADFEQGAGSMAAIAPAAMINPAVGIAMGGSLAAGPAYGQAIEKYNPAPGYFTTDFAKEKAAAYALGQGLIEAGTEYLPLKILFGKSGGHVVDRMVRAFMPELSGEQIATITQDALEQSVLHPEKSWEDYWNERGAAAYQTMKATAGGMGAAGAIRGAAQYVQPPKRNVFLDSLQQEIAARTPIAPAWVDTARTAGRTTPGQMPTAQEADYARQATEAVSGTQRAQPGQPYTGQAAPISGTFPDAYSGPSQMPDIAMPEADRSNLQPSGNSGVLTQGVQQPEVSADPFERIAELELIEAQGGLTQAQSAELDGLVASVQPVDQPKGEPIATEHTPTAQGSAQAGQDFGLTGQSAEDVLTAEKEAKRREESEKQERARADAQAEPFVMTGSNRQADQAEARGQKPLFSRNPSDYQIAHKPLSADRGAARLHDLTPAFGEDIYGSNALQYFGAGDAREKRVIAIMKRVRGNPDAEVTIYRGAPQDAEGINPGDWVTLDRSVAQDYVDQMREDGGIDGTVLSLRVPASTITSWPDSLLEYGYFPETAKYSKPQPTRGLPTAEAESILRKRFGRKVGKMLDAGTLRIVQNESEVDVPEARMASGYGGVWDGKVAWLVSDNLTSRSVGGTFLHEVGEHAGMEAMLGDRYRDLVDRFNGLLKDGNPLAIAAAERVPGDTRPGDVDHEHIAYFVEEADNRRKRGETLAAKVRDWIRDFRAAVRAWVYRNFGGVKLNEDDFVALAKQAAGVFARKGIGSKGGLLQKVWHGTPHIWPPEPGFPHGRPRLDKIFSKETVGENSWSFGAGWYSAESQDVGEGYRNRLTGANPTLFMLGGEKVGYIGDNSREMMRVAKLVGYSSESAVLAIDALREAKGDLDAAAASFWGDDATPVHDEAAKLVREMRYLPEGGALYQLDIPDEVLPYLLDWDRRLSEQTKEVREAIQPLIAQLKKSFPSFNEEIATGKGLYDAYKAHRGGNAKTASEAFASLGIVGNRYLDGQSRKDGTGTSNFVIWDQPTLDRIALLERNGEKLDATREEAKFSKTEPGQSEAEELAEKYGLKLGKKKAELAKKFAYAMAQDADARIRPAAEKVMLDAQQLFEQIKGGVIPHTETLSHSEALAQSLGWSIESVQELMTSKLPEGVRPAEVMGAAIATARVHSLKLLDAQTPTEFLTYTTDVINLMIATRAMPSEAGRLLGHYGWLQRQGGYTPNQAKTGTQQPKRDAPTAGEITQARKEAGEIAGAVKDLLDSGTTPVGATQGDASKFNKAMYDAAGASNRAAELQQEADLTNAEWKVAEKALADARKRREAARAKLVEANQKLAKVGWDKTADALNAMNKYQAATPTQKELDAAEKALADARARRQEAWDKMVAARRLLKQAIAMRENAEGSATAHTGAAQASNKATMGEINKAVSNAEMEKALGGEKGIKKIMDAAKAQGKDLDLGLLVHYLSGVADGIVTTRADDSSKTNRFLNAAMELFQAQILTGYFTHWVNLTSNAANMALEFALIQPVRGLLGGRKGLAATAEGYRAIGGYRKLLSDIWAMMRYNAYEEMPASRIAHLLAQRDPTLIALMRGGEGSKWMDSKHKYIPGKAGKIIRGYGFVPLGVEDSIFKVIPYRFELARQQGAGEAQDIGEAIKFAEYMTFQSHSDVATALSKFATKHPITRPWLLFMKTMTNIMKRLLQLTPVTGQIMEHKALLGMEGKQAQHASMARSLVGIALAALLWYWIDDGDDEDGEVGITGYSPTERRQQAMWRQAGNEQVALRIGEDFYPFYRLDPLAGVVGMVASMKEASRLAKEEDYDNAVASIANGFYQSIVTKHFMKNIADTVEFMMDLARYNKPQEETEDEASHKKQTPLNRVARGVARFGMSMAIPNIVTQTGDVLDEYKRKTRTIEDDIKRKIPTLREDLPEMLSVAGTPVLEPRFHSPYPVNKTNVKKDEAARWMMKLGRVLEPDPVKLRGLDKETRKELLQDRWDSVRMAYMVSDGLPVEMQREMLEKNLRQWGKRSSEAVLRFELVGRIE